jgi:hypothetical protein
MRFRPDEQAVHDDVAALLAAERFTDALVPAALQADRLGVDPRSLTFLAEIVRRGGAEYAAQLPEPLPTPAQSDLVRPWLLPPEADDERLARWLDGVATLIEARRLSAP